MKTNDELPELSNDEKLKAENELLKMKLTAEFGMKDSKFDLPPEIENKWLNHIYDFETLYKNAKMVKIYDFIGRPEFKKNEELAKEKLGEELDRVYETLINNDVKVDFLADYDNETIYKFITEELFEE